MTVLRPLTLHAYLQCLWLLPAGQRGSCRLRKANYGRLEKLTNEGADGRLEVPVAVTGRSKRELSIEERQPSTSGETNRRRRRRKTGRYDSVLRPLTLHAYLQCLWLLPAGQRGSCRLRRANHRRLEKLTNEGADGRLEVPVAVTGLSKKDLSFEESQPSTIGEANQRRRGRKTGSCSAGSRYWPVIEGTVDCGEPTMDDWESQPCKARTEDCCSAGSRYCPVIEGADDCGEPTVDDWGSQPMKVMTEDWKL
nr:unnamed protein product [Spirometra erinaceieuropaei]